MLVVLAAQPLGLLASPVLAAEPAPIDMEIRGRGYDGTAGEPTFVHGGDDNLIEIFAGTGRPGDTLTTRVAVTNNGPDIGYWRLGWSSNLSGGGWNWTGCAAPTTSICAVVPTRVERDATVRFDLSFTLVGNAPGVPNTIGGSIHIQVDQPDGNAGNNAVPLTEVLAFVPIELPPPGAPAPGAGSGPAGSGPRPGGEGEVPAGAPATGAQSAQPGSATGSTTRPPAGGADEPPPARAAPRVASPTAWPQWTSVVVPTVGYLLLVAALLVRRARTVAPVTVVLRRRRGPSHP